ncbi:MAG: hypothetical protein JHC69_11630 [Akkermansiaceae bacterium]|nr:hypothetical protein [Akkermansiaceae bacterium]
MKAMPTLEGGLRIDSEDLADWEVLRSITTDATACDTDLANRLGGIISPEAGGEDWQEFVVPDLREAFQDELTQIGATIEAAMFEADGGPGSIWITREDGFAWYSSFNQARLALEEQFAFGDSESLSPKGLTTHRRSAFIRSRFYCAIQGLLLEHVIK